MYNSKNTCRSLIHPALKVVYTSVKTHYPDGTYKEHSGCMGCANIGRVYQACSGRGSGVPVGAGLQICTFGRPQSIITKDGYFVSRLERR